MDLKPCPFCGENLFLRTLYNTFDDGSFFAQVRCSNCNCKGPTQNAYNTCKEAIADAKSEWNTRTSGWISVDDSLPEGHEYVVLKHKDDGVPPIIGWATYWQPKNRFAGFEVQCASYLEDYSNEFTHWMPLPQMPEQDND